MKSSAMVVRFMRRPWIPAFLFGLAVAALLSPVAARPLFTPRPNKEFAVRLPVFEQTFLANGLSIFSYPDDGLPLVAVTLAVRRGSGAEKSSQAGLAQLAFSLLAEQANDGANDLSTADLGASLRVRVSDDGALLQLQVLSAQAEKAVALLAQMLRAYPATPIATAAPESPATDVTSPASPAASATGLQPSAGNALPSILPAVDARRLSALKLQMRTLQGGRAAQSVAAGNDLIRRLLFSSDHPYGHSVVGTPQTIDAIQVSDVTAFYECTLYPENVALVLTGRLPPGSAQQWGAKYFGRWPHRNQDVARCDPPFAVHTTANRSEVWAISKPGLVQTYIFVGRAMPALGLDAKSIAALELADANVVSAAFHQLRTKKSITYSVGSELRSRLRGGYYILRTAVEAGKTGEALADIMSEMFAAQRNPVSVGLVIPARVREGFWTMARYNTLLGAASRVGDLFLSRLPLSWDADYLRQLPDVGPQLVDEAAYEYFARDHMQIVLVGDPQIIEQQVPRLKLGPLRWLPAESAAGRP